MVRALIDHAEKKLTLEADWQKSLSSGQTIAQTFSLTETKSTPEPMETKPHP
jgi:hypothetical protein